MHYCNAKFQKCSCIETRVEIKCTKREKQEKKTVYGKINGKFLEGCDRLSRSNGGLMFDPPQNIRDREGSGKHLCTVHCFDGTK